MKYKIYKNIKDFGLTSLAALLIISCASKQITSTNTKNVEAEPKLIFLNYSILKDENNKKHIQFINKIITDGKLKSNDSKYLKVGNKGDLKCLQLNKDSIELTSVILKNPLIKHLEFVNDSLIFENKKIELNKTPFSLRLQLHSQTNLIAVKEITDSLQNSNTLIITKLD